jgi:hypothetical protein
MKDEEVVAFWPSCVLLLFTALEAVFGTLFWEKGRGRRIFYGCMMHA